MSFSQAKEILLSKDYIGGGDMRGRQSYNPLEKMGLTYVDNNRKIRITNFGEYFLQEDYDIGEVFFRSLIILASSNEGDIVLDPFFGTGTTGKVAKDINRKWIGIELNEEYFNIAKKRMNYDL